MWKIRDSRRSRDLRRRGNTLMEVMVVSTIMGILMVVPVPHFSKAIEQSKLDVAFGNLRSIWSAQRYYFLEHGTYATLDQLADPQGAALLEPSVNADTSAYAYSIEMPDDRLSFTAYATAKALPKTRCSGSMTIDQSGTPRSNVLYGAGLGRRTDDPLAGAQPPGVQPVIGRRRGVIYLEIQVALVVLGIGLAGLCPLVVMQMKLLRKIESPDPTSTTPRIFRGVRLVDGSPYARQGRRRSLGPDDRPARPRRLVSEAGRPRGRRARADAPDPPEHPPQSDDRGWRPGLLRRGGGPRSPTPRG